MTTGDYMTTALRFRYPKPCIGLLESPQDSPGHLGERMAKSRKSTLYAELKASGKPLTRPYREYTIAVLESELAGEQPSETPPEAPAWAPPPQPAQPEPPRANAPDPNELPGQRQNTKTPDEVIRVDEHGRKWHQEEVLKPAYPKPRGRRVLKYMETGTRTETVKNGEYVETFEVAGKEPGRPAEVKITLPSYQVGIYTDPRFPFKIHCYNGREGFDLEDIEEYFGGRELVPDTVKRVYIENDLCYDIRSVVRTIQTEHRQLQLAGRIK